MFCSCANELREIKGIIERYDAVAHIRRDMHEAQIAALQREMDKLKDENAALHATVNYLRLENAALDKAKKQCCCCCQRVYS